ncbi:MAG: HDOD domain-containing protein, partial [bacterium]|nr:HDOD domain-containing protein [bacterium]
MSAPELIVKIKGDIPTLPIVVTRVLNIILDDKSSIKDLYEAVRVDQALVAKVLRVVNS